MKKSLFDYKLPRELIAEKPVERGHSRMMILSRKSGKIRHCEFSEIVNILPENTSMVFNATKVIPARIFGKKKTGGAVEVLLIKKIKETEWEVMIKSSGKIREGANICFRPDIFCRVKEKKGKKALVRFYPENVDVLGFADKAGDMPLPPYILGKRGEKISRKEDRVSYQTVYAEKPGSVAAPTAGLHFNENLLGSLKKKFSGRIYNVYLNVGPGTFEPVSAGDIRDHKMHGEEYYVPEKTAEKINKDKKNGKMILSVGTTTVRTLESVCENGRIQPGKGETELFIYPGYEYKFVDAVLTNFHLPCSTLLMMISAFTGRENLMNAYKEAVSKSYRFYSYGDCMLILP